MTIKGIISLETLYEGSKSEGKYAIIKTDDEKRLILYRPEHYPAAESVYFAAFAGKEVVAEGKEEREKYFCVETIALAAEQVEESAEIEEAESAEEPVNE